jgi:uncharacterized protein YlxP (DUF503 family)
MVVGISIFELHLPASQSLKAKRKVVKGLVDRIHARFRVSVAETGFHDLHQRSQVTVALVAQAEHELDHLLDEIRSLVDLTPDAVLTSWDPQVLESA